LAGLLENKADADILRSIAEDERRHYEIIKEQTRESVSPSRWRIWFYYILARVFGYTFTLRLMEQREDQAQINYQEVSEEVSPLADIEKDEFEHEEKLIAMLDEVRLKYAGSMVLGLNRVRKKRLYPARNGEEISIFLYLMEIIFLSESELSLSFI